MWFDIVQVTPDGPEHVSGVNGLGGRLIRTIGSWNHRGVGGLAIKALSLLVIPHAELFYLHVPPRYKSWFRAEMNSGPLVLWKQPGRKQCLNKEQPSLQNDHRKLQPCVWPTTLHPPLRPLQPHSCRRAVLGSCCEQCCWTVSNDHGCSHGSVHISPFLDAECNVAASLRPQTTFLWG